MVIPQSIVILGLSLLGHVVGMGEGAGSTEG